MPVYSYVAFDLDERYLNGTIVADTPRQARDQLRGRGMMVERLQEQAVRRSLWRRRTGKTAQGAVTQLISDLATLLQAGIGLLEALRTLQRQHRGRLRAVIQQLFDDVSAGMGLAQAMERQTAYFDSMCVSIVTVGQNTGSLEDALNRLTEYRAKASQLRSRVITAMIYPAVVGVIGLAVTVFLMTYVVPNVLGSLKQSGKPLPAVTEAVMSVSQFLRNWWWLLLAGGAALAAAGAAALRRPRWRLAFDRMVLRLPVMGPLLRMEITARLASVLSALLRSGLQFIEAVRITRQTVSNTAFRHALEQYEEAVAAGRDVAGPLEASGVFPPVVVQVAAVGQQAGELESMLEKLAAAYDRNVTVATGRLAAVIEPLLIVLLAAMVGVVALATILPLLEVSNVW